MHIIIPLSFINAFWGSIGTTVAGALLIFIGVRSNKIPLWWGNAKDNSKMDTAITPEEFDNKLKLHCVSQHAEFNKQIELLISTKMESLFSAQNRTLDKIDAMRETQTDILQRVARIEGAYQMDHK